MTCWIEANIDSERKKKKMFKKTTKTTAPTLDGIEIQCPGRWEILQIVFIGTASSQANKLLVVIMAVQERRNMHRCRSFTNSSFGIFSFPLKRGLWFVKDLNQTWNQLFVHFLSTPFAFKDTAVFVVHTAVAWQYNNSLSNEYAAIQKSQKGWVSDSFGRCNAKP